jgi:hypothetical protein
LHALGVIRGLAERLDIGGDPSKAVRRVLLPLQCRAVDLAAGGNAFRESGDGLVAQHSRRLGDGLKLLHEIGGRGRQGVGGSCHWSIS